VGLLIGPEDERWDQVMLVRQHSVEAFLAFAADEVYLAGLPDPAARVEHLQPSGLIANPAFSHVVQDQSLGAAVAVFQREWGPRPNPPAITLHIVAGLAHPDFLAEIDAIAVVP